MPDDAADDSMTAGAPVVIRRSGAVLAWTAAPFRTSARLIGRTLLAGMLAPGASLGQVCPACGGPHGPLLVRVGDAPGPLVSVSYADGFVAVGVAPEGARAFGIDVEFDDAATRRAVGEAIGARMVSSWTRGEAVAKARRTGLRGALPRTMPRRSADRSGSACHEPASAGRHDHDEWTTPAADAHRALGGFDIRIDSPRRAVLSVALA
ncbi:MULTISPECIES: hypothetical protein [unclassified Microbacterium]|uniref:hypothetical protein n=1 Tax=unclassified Microbacterium TaxID=2609290 RepID=UPI00097F29F4|nr:hypothetical protein [Microbacterium sp. JB110]RCS62796.1 hypothetical protein CIK77_00800 [Microbacterium sp. JB110]SJM62611.1 hypothetical protein CZ774_11430 [Frigoribacterium sp. JB110]